MVNESEFPLVKEIDLSVLVVSWGVDGLVVVDPPLPPLFFFHAVAVQPGHLNELADELLCNAD
jgi:hypothetical protein